MAMRAWLAFLFGLFVVSPAVASEVVEFPSGEDLLRGELFKPTGKGPFPVVVALHGCGGLMSRSGDIRPIYRDWGERLAAAGYAVLFPDSFGSRHLGSQCKTRNRHVRPRRERTRDAFAARRWLQEQPWTNADRVYLMGWSNGGSTTLWTVRRPVRLDDRYADFRAAVAFYPGCRQPANSGWSARVPTLILIGAADDWTPPAACEAMIADARGRSALVDIKLYPGAYHGFDQPNMPIRERVNLAFTANGSGRAHIGTNEAARNDAIKRVTEWFAH
jgi:dienelactone hydrolase